MITKENDPIPLKDLNPPDDNFIELDGEVLMCMESVMCKFRFRRYATVKGSVPGHIREIPDDTLVRSYKFDVPVCKFDNNV